MTLSDRVSALSGPGGLQKLDVEVEVAMFEPDIHWACVRPSSSGVKVIYTDHAGHETTAWAGEWTVAGRRCDTIDALKARGL